MATTSDPAPPARTLYDRIFGRPLASNEEDEQKVGVAAGLPMLGLDGLSSAAYGPEAALTLLIPLGAAGIHYIGPIVGLIVVLLGIVYISYRQTIAAYPHGGGSYTVAHENLGTIPGLMAAAALLIDYILTAAVGISAGVGALVSAAPRLHPHILTLCLVILAVITLVNLRGVREAGVAFLLPTYLFIASILGLIACGIFQSITSGGHPTPMVAPPKPSAPAEAVGFWLLMRAFASGCTAMTGVEAVSNGVMVFRDPTVPNARRTLSAIIGVLALMLAGIAYLCTAYGIGATDPGSSGYRSVLEQLAAAVLGEGVFYFVTIGSVLTVLCLSANTAFADFPRLCRALAIDSFLPHGFAQRGRRLVYSQGIIVLAVLTAALLAAFGGITDRLIPLYAVGAFLAFTLSQAGMVQHWRKAGGDHAGKSIAVNGIGAACTGITLVVVLVSKFVEGAWVTALMMPGLLLLFLGIRKHYRTIGRQVASDEPVDAAGIVPAIAVLPIRGWSRITRKALRVALRISPDVYVVHVSYDEDYATKLTADWHRLAEAPAEEAGHPAPKLVVLPSPYRQLFSPLLDYVQKLAGENPDRKIAIIIPELVERVWWQFPLHNQAAAVMKAQLLFSGLRKITVINVPWYLED